MDAAESTRAHEADADGGGRRERPADRRRTDRLLDCADGEVARAELARTRREPLQGGRREPDVDGAVEDADRGGYRACSAYGGLARKADLDSVRRREAVCHERRLERDNSLLVLERSGDLLADVDQVEHASSLAQPSPRGHSPRVLGPPRRAPTSPRGTPGALKTR